MYANYIVTDGTAAAEHKAVHFRKWQINIKITRTKKTAVETLCSSDLQR